MCVYDKTKSAWLIFFLCSNLYKIKDGWENISIEQRKNLAKSVPKRTGSYRKPHGKVLYSLHNGRTLFHNDTSTKASDGGWPDPRDTATCDTTRVVDG